jgi:hypothetical protein
LLATNELGQCFTLSELAELGLANPRIRRSELMVRIFGFEYIANELGHAGEFYTITCPSRMHARHSGSGEQNSKYDGTTPKQAQKYLNKVWSRIRAKLKRSKLPFTVSALPNRNTTVRHTGTCCYSCRPDKSKKSGKSCGIMPCEADGDEPGAQQHRFKAIPIDKSKGSAVGYIAKYISKNIDGHGLEKRHRRQPDTGSSGTSRSLGVNLGHPAIPANRRRACFSIWRELQQNQRCA